MPTLAPSRRWARRRFTCSVQRLATKPTPNSDIDLFIDYDPRGRFSVLDLVAAKRLLETGLGVEVDLTTRKGLHPLIRKQVEAEATRVF